MNKTLIFAVLAALPLSLASCDKKTESPSAEAPNVAATSDAMPEMVMPADAKMGKASGTVTAIDATAGKITLDHGAIPAVGWPAMKMGFSAKPDVLAGISVGDEVDFDVTVSGSAGEVTRIEKR